MQAQACEARRYQNLIDNDDTLVPVVGEVPMGGHAAANIFSLRDLNSWFNVASQALAALRN
jgi:hypothetical protein